MPTAGDHLLGAEVGDRLQVREVAAADVVGVLLGDLLDVDPAHVAEQHHRPLGAAVPEHRRVVLLLDLGLGVDQDADRHVAADLELEDLGGVLLGLLRRVGELDAAGLHPPAAQHLGLDHGRAVDLLGGRLAGLGGRLGEAVLGDRDPGQLDDPPAFVFVEAHGVADAEPYVRGGQRRRAKRLLVAKASPRTQPGDWRVRHPWVRSSESSSRARTYRWAASAASRLRRRRSQRSCRLLPDLPAPDRRLRNNGHLAGWRVHHVKVSIPIE